MTTTAFDDARTAALAAYRRFFAGFNSRQPEAWAAALHFPHVRVASRGPVRVVPSLEAHVAAMSWDAVEATGWDHTDEQEPEIVHAGADRVHIAGGWTRYTKEKQPILSTNVTYIVTRVGDSGDDSWGIQSRFAVDAGPNGLSDEQAPAATKVVQDYLAAWNGKRFADAATQLNYPAVQVHPGRLVVWDSAEDHRAWLEAQPWREITLVGARTVQGGVTAVDLALRLAEAGKERDALVLVTQRDGRWGFQAESTVE